MKKSDIELKLKFIEAESEMIEKTSKWTKSTDRNLLLMGIVTTIAIMFTRWDRNSLHVLDVFAISLLVSTLHKHITDMMKHKHDDRHKLMMLDLDKKYYSRLLKIEEAIEEEKCNDRL